MSNNVLQFKGKVAIITGAAQGMGRQIALDLAHEGAIIVALDVNGESINSLKKEIETEGGQCLSIVCNVASSREVEKAIKTAIRSFNTVEILVNSAGILTTGNIEDTSDELIDKTLNVNVKGVLYTIRSVTPIMKSHHYGRIINIASITGKRGDNTTVPVYGASKGAVISLTRSMARELGPFGVTVNAIAPHAIMTKMMSYWTEEKKRREAEKIPVKDLEM